MGDLFWNKVAGVLIGAVLAVMAITELGHLLVPSHGAHELTDENTSYPVDWAAIESGGGEAEPVEEGPTDYGLLLANADISNGERDALAAVPLATPSSKAALTASARISGVLWARISRPMQASPTPALLKLWKVSGPMRP